MVDAHNGDNGDDEDVILLDPDVGASDSYESDRLVDAEGGWGARLRLL